ncbi:MAG: amino acid adenylation domain-containing protein [Rhodocyclaceae bacterium]
MQQASIPIGRPVANSRVYILDDRGAPTLPGEAGELCVAGDGLSPGYIGRDDLTQACFVDLPPPLGERVYRTGDLGCWLDDGTIRYLGRRDAQIKLRGYRIELSEVESALNRLDGVRRAAVMVAGSGEDRHLLALLCPERDVTPDPEALLAALAGQLPAYMLPQAWVRVDALPINANGKLDRAALPALAGQGMRLGAPARVRAVPEAGEDTSGEGADGADALESRIAAVFAELLGVPVLATEVDADFFALGGQSLKAMRLLARLEKTLGVRLPLREVMHHATVGALAARVRERLAAQPAGPARGGDDAPERASGQALGDALQPPAVSMIVPVGEWPDYPLSSGQERLWFLQRLQPQASTYNVPFAVAFATPVDERALDAALGRLEARHDALRLRMPDSLRGDGTLRQTLASAGALRLTVCACDSEPARAASMAADLARPFAFGAGAPLVRAALYRLAEARSGQAELRGQAEGAARDVLLLVFHHLVCDGWSGEVLFRELREAYAAAASTATALPTPQWPVPALRYVDYAVWQRGWLEGAEAAAMRARWVARLSPLPEALSLPTDRPRPALRDTHGGVLKLRIGSALEAALRQRAQAAGQTLFTLLLGVVKLWLYRHAGQRDLVVGVPVAGRTDAALHPLVGFLVNTVPVRTRLVPEQGFGHLLAQVAGSLGEALEDQAYPLESLVQALKVPRDSARNPLFDVLVAYEGREWAHHDTGAGPAGGAPQGDGHALPAMQPYPLTSGHSRLDLGLYFREQPEGLTLELEYASALFEQDTMARMAERLQVLLDAVCTRAPDEALDRLPWMSADEREQVLHGFNDTAEPWSLEASIDDCFRRQCARNPHAVALRGRDGVVLDHAQLDARVTRLAHELLAAGVRPGRHVGVCGERSVELIVAIFAVLRVGAVYVPLLPGLPQERLASMAEDMPGLVVLAEASQLPVFGQLGLTAWPIGGALGGPVGGPVRGPDAERQQDAGAGTDEGAPCASGTGFPPVPADAVAYVIFTSGSTGRPKGVEVVHRGVLNRLFWMQSRFPLDASDVILQKTPVSFDVSVWELFWWSWSGASLALLAPGDERDPAAIVRAIERHRVTVMHFVPSMLRAFIEHLETHPDAVPRLASLRRVFASGEALTPELVQRFNRLLHARHASELHNLYGPTEATVDVSWYPCLPLPGEPAGMPASVPIGRPISNTRLYVLDALQQPVPVGVCGELYIAGVQLARGYLARPGLTAERFVPDPFMPGERMYRSGDLARWLPDGNIEYLGRCDDQVKIRGFRIELGEVEAALERCEGVAQAVVRVGEVGGMPALEAFVVPRAGHVPEAAALRSGLHAFLPDYMCPSLFYRLDSLPLSASGKADRKALRGVRLGGASAARGATPDSARGAVPGMNAAEGAGGGDTLEQALCALWSEILPEAGEIGPDDGFFDIGGSSLLLIRLHEALEARWPELFSLPELFVSVTPRQQALHIRARNRGPGSVQAMEQATGARPVPVPAQGAVAVIGLALRLSDYDDPDSFWSDLLSGADRVGELSAQRREDVRGMLAAMGVQADPARLRPAAFLDDIAGFDCRRFGLAPGDATLLDPEQRLFLETAARALEDAGYGGQALDGQRVGVFVGASPSQAFKEAISRSFPERAEEGYILNVPSSVATRLGYLHDWDGPAELVDTACSSSLKAVRDACQALQRGECTVALAGGARVLLTPLRGDKAFAIETRSGRTRTFDAAADGVGAGEGAVALLLKPLAAAQADGDAIHAVILGSAVNQDGRSSSMAAPSPAAQARVILAAAREAGVPLDSVDFFEAHGTATVLGDPIEIDGLRRAFSAVTQAGETAQARPPLIASVKGNFGHLDAAAGALGMARAILALARGVVPAQAHFERPNPRLELVSAPVEVAARNHPLPPAGRPWRAGVSAFGLSGINVHVLLEQAPRPGWPAEDGRWHCVPLSAGSQPALRRYVRALIEALAAHPEWPLQAIAATLIAGREHLACRLAVQACSRDGLLQALLDWWLEAPGAPVCSGLLADGKHRRPAATGPCVQAAGLPDEHAARAAAQAFVGGAMPQWPQAEPLYRVHLPPAPMERQRCWPVFRPLAGARRPCLSGPWVTPEGSVFPLALAAEDFWPVAEHVLAGQPTLVGMALPGLLLEAAGRVRGGAGGAGRAEGGWSIGALHWLRPLSVAQLVPDSVNLTLVAQADGSWRARLRGCVHPAQAPSVPGAAGEAREGDEWHDFAEATLTPHPARSAPPAPLEVAALRAGMQPVERPASSAIEAGGALQVSARWDCRRKTWRSEDGRRTLAWLVLDERWLGDLDDFPWHPAMLDVAASLALDGGGRVPAACREMRLHAPPGRAFYALASRREAQDGDLRRTQPGALHVDCVLFDADGRVLAEWLGLVFVPMQAPAARLHALHWQDVPWPAGPVQAHAGGDTVLIGAGPECAALARALQDRGRVCRVFALPQDEAQRSALVAGVLADGVTQVVQVLAGGEEDCGWPQAAMLRALLRAGLRRPLPWWTLGQGALAGVAPEPGLARTGEPAAALALGLMLSLRQEEAALLGCHVECPEWPAAEGVLDLLDRLDPSDAEPLRLLSDREGHAAGQAPVLQPPVLQRRVLGPAQPVDERPAGGLPEGEALQEWPRPLLSRPPAGSCLLVTGGLGAMALTLVAALARAWREAVPVALLHRTPFALPADGDLLAAARQARLAGDPLRAERLNALHALREQGVAWTLFECDVSDAAALHATLAEVRRQLGVPGGVLHTAGVAGGGFLLGRSREAYEAVLAPKVRATRLLHEATLHDPLAFFVMMSSRTALLGAPGQGDYAAANAYLDAFAGWRRAQGLPALSMAWNTWAQIGMAVRHGAYDPAHPALLPGQAGAVLVQALGGAQDGAQGRGSSHVVVSVAGEFLPGERAQAGPSAGSQKEAQPAPDEPSLSVAQRVLRAVGEELGYAQTGTPLTLEDDFYALGGDSISGLRIVNRLARELGRQVSLADLFANSRLGDLAQAIGDRDADAATGAGADEATTATDPSAHHGGGAVDGPRPAPPSARHVLSWEQLAVVQAEALALPNTGFNLPQFLRLPSGIGADRLRAALRVLMQRHEILRTRLVDLHAGEPAMEVLDPEACHLPFEQVRVAWLDDPAVERLLRPFRLDEAPLFRAALIESQADGPVLFFDIHHSMADAQGVQILLDELYRLCVHDPHGAHLPPAGLQQKEAAWWQRGDPARGAEALAQDARARAYWLAQYADAVPLVDLPADYPRPRHHTHRGGVVSFEVPAGWLPAIRSLARAHATTAFTVMLGLWSVLLARATGRDELVIAVAVDGREHEAFARTAGMFASLLPLRLRPGRAASLAELFEQHHRQHGEALRHRSFMVNRLLAELKLPMMPERTPLTEISFSYMNFAGVSKTGEGFEALQRLNPASKGDLSIFGSDTGERLGFALEYYADLFAHARIEGLAEAFLQLLRRVLDQGTAALPFSYLPLADPMTHRAGAAPGVPPPSSREAARAGGGTPAPGEASEPSGGAVLDRVLAVFRTVFEQAELGPDDSFFELGGHSLLGLQIVNQLLRLPGGEGLNIRDLFDHPSPAAMAARIGVLAGQRGGQGPIVARPAAPDGLYPLSHAQQRLYVLHHTDEGAVAYNMPFMFHFDRAPDAAGLARLRDALLALCARHEVLRTVFVEQDGQLWQKVVAPRVPAFIVDDVYGAETPDQAQAQALQLAAGDALRPFDLGEAPLMRLRLCRLPDGQALLSLVMHHVIGDGWSMQVFLGEWLALHEALSQGRSAADALPPLPLQYRDYALWQQGRDWSEEAAYWRDCLSGAPSRIALPVDAPPGACGAGVLMHTLPPALVEALRGHARQRGVSLATLMLTLFVALLYRLTRQQDMVIGMGVAGRERAELEGLIGFFVNILPVRVRLDDDTELDGLLDRVHRASVEAQARQDYPFDLLVRALQQGAGGARQSLLNVMFEYQRYSDLQGINRVQAQSAGALSGTPLDPAASLSANKAGEGVQEGATMLAKYDLTLFVQDEPSACRLKLEYDRALLSDATAAQWLAYLERFMQMATAAPAPAASPEQ